MTLDLATSEQLVDELFLRYPHAVFLGVKDSHDMEDEWTVYQRWHGHSIVMQGLCTRLIRKIQDTEDFTPGKEEDL
jgi:hypothetical protein